VKPDLVWDCHELPEDWTDKWEFVISDSPYDDELSKQLYGTGHINYRKYAREAVRVCKPGGHIAIYHFKSKPNPFPGACVLVRRIMLETRLNHHLRICKIYKKLEGAQE
jgi:hypothetical protein